MADGAADREPGGNESGATPAQVLVVLVVLGIVALVVVVAISRVGP